MEIQKQREAFGVFIANKYKDLIDQRVCINSDGDYMAWDMQVAWATWQAATAQAVPEGFVLVPKEPTTHQVDYCQTMKFRKGVGRSHKFEDIFVYKAMIEAQEQSHD